MATDPVSLEFLGEQLKRVQADIRDLKGRVLLVENDQASMARDLARIEGKVDDLTDRTDERFEQVDRRFEQVDRRFEQVDRRFDEMNQVAATNLKIILTALEGMRAEIRDLTRPS